MKSDHEQFAEAHRRCTHGAVRAEHLFADFGGLGFVGEVVRSPRFAAGDENLSAAIHELPRFLFIEAVFAGVDLLGDGNIVLR